MLINTFLQLINKYANNNELATNLCLEVTSKYSEPKRHYHNFQHLEDMVADLQTVKEKISDWETMLFAVIYHDCIYKASSTTNEEESAKVALQRLSEIGYPAKKIAMCANMILATKQHETSEDSDTN